jgi:hypothetical protein
VKGIAAGAGADALMDMMSGRDRSKAVKNAIWNNHTQREMLHDAMEECKDATERSM